MHLKLQSARRLTTFKTASFSTLQAHQLTLTQTKLSRRPDHPPACRRYIASPQHLDRVPRDCDVTTYVVRDRHRGHGGARHDSCRHGLPFCERALVVLTTGIRPYARCHLAAYTNLVTEAFSNYGPQLHVFLACGPMSDAVSPQRT